jgi:site-specific DNA recombinase
MKPGNVDVRDLPVATADARRCAIYARTSIGIRNDPDLAALNVQRVVCAAYIRHQLRGSWIATYEDHGCRGVGLERPALQRLLADIDAAKIEAVVVLELDRLSRSLPELARLMMRFDEAGVLLVAAMEPRSALQGGGGQIATRRRGRR